MEGKKRKGPCGGGGPPCTWEGGEGEKYHFLLAPRRGNESLIVHAKKTGGGGEGEILDKFRWKVGWKVSFCES